MLEPAQEHGPKAGAAFKSLDFHLSLEILTVCPALPCRKKTFLPTLRPPLQSGKFFNLTATLLLGLSFPSSCHLRVVFSH